MAMGWTAEWLDFESNIDYVSRLRNESVEQPIITRFTTFSIKLHDLQNTGNLAGTEIVIEQDYLVEGGRARKECIPYLLGHKGKGHRASLGSDQLVVDGCVYNVDSLKK
jgi:hypothetical protein